MTSGRIFQFGDGFQVDALARTLRRGEEVLTLNRRAFDVLLYLVQNSGRLLGRDELLENVWPDTFVDESSLVQSIYVLRRALEEKPGDNSYIVTLPGRGYQFVSAVRVVAPEEVAAVRAGGNSSGLIFQKHTVETSVITSTNEEREPLSSPISRRRLLIRVVAALLAMVVAVALVLRYPAWRHPEQKHELVERQLTANPPENAVSSQAVSRDGKYLAYRDFLSNNLHLLAIDSEEIRHLPLPAQYDVDDWFPDGSHLLLQSDADGGGLWKVSTWDSSLRKLWSGPADLAMVSPDGSHIAFVKDQHEVWLVGSDGEEPHRILASDATLVRLAWSPTGQRLAYVQFRGPVATGRAETAIETIDLAGGARTVVLSDPHLFGWAPGIASAAWLPDGRLIYENFSGDTESNLWAIRVDPSTGQPSGDPSRVAGWKDFEAELPQASADGKRLIALRQRTEDTIYVGDLASGKVFTPHRIVLDDWSSLVTGWTKDSRAILFYSKWKGRLAIFKQDLDAKTPETLISGPENYLRPRVSAEGTLLYTATASTRIWEPGDPTIRLMSTPLQGGPRSTLMMGRYEYKCGLSPSSSCVVSELKDTQLTFFYLDPVKGRGEEIASIAGYKGVSPRWDLSPDGSKIAIVDEGEQKGEIRILSLTDRRISVLPVRNSKWMHLQHISWAADGENLFALEFDSSVSLVFIDKNGTRKVLYEIPGGAGWISSIAPSPDGKHLAMSKRVSVGDVMLLENF